MIEAIGLGGGRSGVMLSRPPAGSERRPGT